MTNAERIPLIEESLLGRAPCDGCSHRVRCSDTEDPVSCRDFAIHFVERDELVHEHRIPARFWALFTLEIDGSSEGYNEGGLPVDWQDTYWRGVTVAAATRNSPAMRALLLEEEHGLLSDLRLARVFDAGLADADENNIRSSQVWRSYCRLSGPPPRPLVSPEVDDAVKEVKRNVKPCAVFVESNGDITVVPLPDPAASARVESDPRATVGVFRSDIDEQELIGEIVWARSKL